ncbi:MAG TPA: choice-of-anchor tandem repeat GloVer-containing protein [Candidatus Binatia bacterium]|nr:choice-of-anchor tandem repeat GloVer-containing protein [Candidatus Binatia bacterium]
MKNPTFSKMACAFVFCFATLVPASSQITYTTLATLDPTTGLQPFGPLVQALDGNLYGTTLVGGINCSPFTICGTIFKITSAGTLTNFYNFCSLPNCTDGGGPQSGLLQALDGNLYGTTTYGGIGGENSSHGTLFKIDPAGSLSTLYMFCALPNCVDGEEPRGNLIQALDGNFYGTTFAGGAFAGAGNIFRLTTASGNLRQLYNFCSQPGCADGSNPTAALLQAPDRNFYGTTEYGGTYGYGTIFKLVPGGALTTLYSFCPQQQTDCPDGQYPSTGALALSSDGGFYGTTQAGGAYGQGTAFRISRDGALITLHSFCRGLLPFCPDGAEPLSGVIQATDGNFYGIAHEGGSPSGGGLIFKMTPQGSVSVVYDFCSRTNCTDGLYPQAGLVQATDGSLYGTTISGSTPNYGVVFRLSLGLAPFVETLPLARQVGTQVIILGTNLTASTAVNFNGTSAPFTIVSATEITATVPAGATTGFVTVAVPSGTLTSNRPFQVLP